jgi:hypothetical protein
LHTDDAERRDWRVAIQERSVERNGGVRVKERKGKSENEKK